MFNNFLRYNFSGSKIVRKYLGGYWEQWIVEIIHSPVWLVVDKEQAYDPMYRPGCGHGIPYCEYYPIEFFGSKKEFTKERIIILNRKLKLERMLN